MNYKVHGHKDLSPTAAVLKAEHPVSCSSLCMLYVQGWASSVLLQSMYVVCCMSCVELLFGLLRLGFCVSLLIPLG